MTTDLKDYTQSGRGIHGEMPSMVNEIGLFYDNQERGPGKVRDNLIKGLELLGVKVYHNVEGKHTGWLHGRPNPDTPDNWLLGPNMFTLPLDIGLSFWENKTRKLVTPATWTTELYKKQLEGFVAPHIIHTWAVGIDTEKFVPSKEEPTNDCLIYFKNGSTETKENLKNVLDEKGLSYEEIEYGSYNENDLINTAHKSKFCVTITSTESQGIAYQEILSMNVPCYVVDKTTWNDRSPFVCPASSAPYFDGRCGMKCSDLSAFDTFLNYMGTYKPRDYILDNLTLEKCASDYIKLF